MLLLPTINYKSRGEEEQTFSGHSGYVKSVAFSPDGHLILLGTTWRYHYLFRNMIYALENNVGVIELTEAQRERYGGEKR